MAPSEDYTNHTGVSAFAHDAFAREIGHERLVVAGWHVGALTSSCWSLPNRLPERFAVTFLLTAMQLLAFLPPFLVAVVYWVVF